MSKEVKRWDELKALAEAAKAAQETHLSSDSEQAYDAWAHLDDQFSDKATPATVLDLLADYDALRAERDRMAASLDEIGGLCRALRQGGPDPMDLEDLSNALEQAVDLAHNALQGAQP